MQKLDNYCINELQKYLLNSEWSKFMVSTNKYACIYKYSRIIYLNRKYSQEYLVSEKFRNIINSKIFNPINQLGLNLNNYTINDNIDDEYIENTGNFILNLYNYF